MNTKKILFTIGFFGTGGKEKQLSVLIRNLPKNEFQAFLLCNGGDSHFFKELKKDVVGFQVVNLVDFISFFKYITKVNPETIYCWSRPTAYLVLIHKYIFRGKYKLVNASIRSAPVEKSIMTRLHGLLYNFFPYVVANSKEGLRAFGQYSKPNRFVLCNSIEVKKPLLDKQEIRRKLGIPDGKFVISMVAGFKKTKDHLMIVEALSKYLRNEDNILVYFVGDGAGRKNIEKKIYDNKIKNVVIPGSISDTSEVLFASDLSTLCSTNGEGMPNSILESLAVGTPVIATKGGGTGEIVKDSVNGYLIDIGDAEEFSDKVKFLMKNKNVLDRMSEESKNIVKDFNVLKMIEQFKRI